MRGMSAQCARAGPSRAKCGSLRVPIRMRPDHRPPDAESTSAGVGGICPVGCSVTAPREKNQRNAARAASLCATYWRAKATVAGACAFLQARRKARMCRRKSSWAGAVKQSGQEPRSIPETTMAHYRLEIRSCASASAGVSLLSAPNQTHLTGETLDAQLHAPI